MKKKTKILLIISAIIGVALYLFVYRGYDSYSDGCIYSSRELIKLKQDLCLANDIANAREEPFKSEEEYHEYFLKVLDSLDIDTNTHYIRILWW